MTGDNINLNVREEMDRARSFIQACMVVITG